MGNRFINLNLSQNRPCSLAWVIYLRQKSARNEVKKYTFLLPSFIIFFLTLCHRWHEAQHECSIVISFRWESTVAATHCNYTWPLYYLLEVTLPHRMAHKQLKTSNYSRTMSHSGDTLTMIAWLVDLYPHYLVSMWWPAGQHLPFLGRDQSYLSCPHV